MKKEVENRVRREKRWSLWKKSTLVIARGSERRRERQTSLKSEFTVCCWWRKKERDRLDTERFYSQKSLLLLRGMAKMFFFGKLNWNQILETACWSKNFFRLLKRKEKKKAVVIFFFFCCLNKGVVIRELLYCVMMPRYWLLLDQFKLNAAGEIDFRCGPRCCWVWRWCDISQ